LTRCARSSNGAWTCCHATYRQKLSPPRTGGLSWPSWEHDQRFELEAHVRHATLPSPGDEHEFLDWISDFYSHRLDRSRPLWEVALLGGLAHERWALVWKTHHCLVDGVGSVDIAHLLLDTEPTPPEPAAGHAAPGSASAEARHRWLPDSPALLAQTAGASIGGRSRRRARAAASPRGGGALAGGDRPARPRPADRGTALEPERADQRKQIATAHADLQELQQVRSAVGGTVNDVVLCAA
jgi:diacylglycerol O-acyltransferase